MSRRARVLAFLGIAAVFLAATLPLALRLGFNAEETVGLLRKAPERLYPAGASVTDSERDARPGMRTSGKLPVWGYVADDGAFLPIMIDGHVGAVSFYPSRVMARIGPSAARVLSVGFGVLALLLIFALGKAIGGERVGWAAAVIAATSSHMVFLFIWVRPDEQLDAVAHLAAVLCMIRFARDPRLRWFALACFLFGFGVACKNTALWTLFAIGGAALMRGLIPRVRPRDWALGACAFAVPLLPEVAFLIAGEGGGAMSGRLSMISAPWEGLAPDNLAYSVRHFADSVGHGGSFMGGFIAGEPGRGAAIPGVGYLMFALTLVAVGAGFSRSSGTGVRAFGAGLGLLLLQYVTFYYRGHSYYLLLAPWLPIAIAVAAVALYNAAGELGAAARGLVIAVGALILVNAAVETVRYHSAAASPGAGMFDRAAQERVVRVLREHGEKRPIVTTYGGVGVYELLSDGELDPRYAFGYFHGAAGGDRSDYRRAWGALLERLGAGRHVFVIVPNPSPVDTSPLTTGGLIAEELEPTARARGARVRTLDRVSRRGRPILSVVEVEAPH